MNHFVIDRPKSVEIKHLFVPLGNWLHFPVRLISNTVVDEFQIWNGQNFVERFCHMVSFIAREEWAVIVSALNERMDSVAVCFDRGYSHCSALILQFFWFANRDGSS